MSYPKNPVAYPPEYFEILVRASKKAVIAQFTDVKKARNFVNKFGNFKRAIIDSEAGDELIAIAHGTSITREQRGEVTIVTVSQRICETELLEALK